VPACGYYSFTGASIPAHLNTIAIPLVEDQSVSPITTLSDDLTQLLVARFVGQTRLSLQPGEDEADAVLTGRIERYSNEPASVGGEERATRNRVTITVSVVYLDRTRNEPLLERSFTGFDEYDPAGGLDGEAVAAATALQRIADDIFTAATSNW
jgi:hypothetical protein